LVTAPTLPPNSAGVFGRVVGPDGTAITGAKVEALDPNLATIQSATTAEDGAYQLIVPILAQRVPTEPVRILNAGTVAAGATLARSAATLASPAVGAPGIAGSVAGAAAGVTGPTAGTSAASATGSGTTDATAAAAPASLTVTLRASSAGMATLTSTEHLVLQVGTSVVRQLTLMPLAAAPPPQPVPPPLPVAPSKS
jgi:hypothetical protein